MTGGDFRGRRLRAPKGEATRPTSDRVRESLFAWLPELAGASVLDLYAGTGALGIEALSRGARRAVFVERARPALAALGANLADLALDGRDARAARRDVRAALARLAREGARFDAIFMDPPVRRSGRACEALRAIGETALLAPQGMLVVETVAAPSSRGRRGARRARTSGATATPVLCATSPAPQNASDAEEERPE